MTVRARALTDIPSVVTSFESLAARRHDAVAVIVAGRQYSYRELDRRAEGIADQLRAAGCAEPETIVGLCIERSFETVAGLLGILKCGAGYLPLDPAYPRERLEFMLTDAGARVLLVGAGDAAVPPLPGLKVLCVEDHACPATTRGESRAMEDLAYVIYTSGSTGRPKGVAVTQANLAFSTRARIDYYGEPVGRFLLLSSFAFDSSVAGIFWTLCSGGALVLPDPGAERDAAQLAGVIDSLEVTHLLALPSLYALLLEQPGSLASLQTAIVAGESCPPALTKSHFARLPSARLFNEYGPTEATVWSTVQPIDRPMELVPIGHAIPGAEIRLLDETLQPATTGEIFVGGPGVTRGYLHRPELTAERFVSIDGMRFYRTGDRASRLADGSLQFHGRTDHQVKIRGHRIELEEIESALRAQPGVHDAAASLSSDQRLVGYFCGTTNGTTLRAALASTLPEPMIPAHFVQLPQFPLHPNGKINRSALPEPGRDRPALAMPFRAPATVLEQSLASIWKEVLRLDSIGLDDPFFELGGDSLLAATVAARLQETLGEPVFVVALFEAPTIARLAQFLEQNYPAAISRLHGQSTGVRPNRRIDAAILAQARAVLAQKSRPLHSPAAPRNSPALFILAPPRSGTTLLRAMLAGHPGLFTASELHLLEFNSLAERRTTLTGAQTLWLEGTIRALMDLHACDAAVAARQMTEMENLTTSQFYAALQPALAGRMLVEKTPAYSLDPHALPRAEAIFDGPLYLHLSRHPSAMIDSFVRNHLDQVYFRSVGDFTAREAAELVWLISHRQTLDFLSSIPAARQFTLRFEDLVRDPRRAMEELCARFGLSFHEEMIRPYDDLRRRTLPGLHAESKSMDDPKFSGYRAIDPTIADRPTADATLGALTRHLAAELGHDTGSSPSQSRARSVRGALDQRAQLRRSSRLSA